MKAKARIITALIAVVWLLIGVIAGRYSAIYSAELTHATDTGYEITFGNSTHYYEY